jgi:hypothetical protein
MLETRLGRRPAVQRACRFLSLERRREHRQCRLEIGSCPERVQRDHAGGRHALAEAGHFCRMSEHQAEEDDDRRREQSEQLEVERPQGARAWPDPDSRIRRYDTHTYDSSSSRRRSVC